MKRSHSKLIDHVQREFYPELSKRRIKQGIEAKGCFVNGLLERFASRTIGERDRIEIDPSAFEKKSSVQMETLFEDEWLRVVCKPPGVVCDFPLQVHRLDKETSGLLILPKTEESLEKLQKQFADRHVKKEYLVVVQGVVNKDSGRIDNHLSVEKRWEGQKKYAVSREGKRAITEWKKEASNDALTLLRCYPITGRTHQIRVHLAHLGHPVLGDYQYGHQAKFSKRVARHMLHAHRLKFSHPFTGENLEFETRLPDDFSKVVECAFSS